MDAVCYTAPKALEIVHTSVPSISEDQVLIKVSCCGICGTDRHIADGEFLSKFPLIPGHELVGKIERIGSAVTGFSIGDRCVADPTVFCETCFFCRRGQAIRCENFESLGVTMAGGFGEYVVVKAKKVYKIFNLTDEEATLIEPAACALHGLDKLEPPVGTDILVIGAGPTGLILAQLLKLNGAAKVTIASNQGVKMEMAKSLQAGDAYVELDRVNPKQQWDDLLSKNPYGFDIVVEATGSAAVATDALRFVRRGGTLLIYGVYSFDASVKWEPYRIFRDEIKIIGSFAQEFCFPRAIAYLDSGKVNVKGMVTHSYTIHEFQQALDKMDSKDAVKVVVKHA